MAIAKGKKVAIQNTNIIGVVASAAAPWATFVNGQLFSFADADISPDEFVSNAAPPGAPAIGDYVFVFDARWQVEDYGKRGGAGANLQALVRYNENNPAFPYRAYVVLPP